LAWKPEKGLEKKGQCTCPIREKLLTSGNGFECLKGSLKTVQEKAEGGPVPLELIGLNWPQTKVVAQKNGGRKQSRFSRKSE